MDIDPELKEQIEKAEKRYAEHPEEQVFAHLADLYRKAGQHEQALAILEQGLKHHPDYVTAYVVRGRTLLDAERREEANDVFSQVIDLDPENRVAMRNLGDLARERGDLEEAQRWYGRILRLDPLNDEVQQIMADLTGEDLETIDEKARRAAGSAKETVAYWSPEAQEDVKDAVEKLRGIDEEEGEEAEPAESEEEEPVVDEEPEEVAASGAGSEPEEGDPQETVQEAKDAVRRLQELYPDAEEEGEEAAEEELAEAGADEEGGWEELDLEEPAAEAEAPVGEAGAEGVEESPERELEELGFEGEGFAEEEEAAGEVVEEAPAEPEPEEAGVPGSSEFGTDQPRVGDEATVPRSESPAGSMREHLQALLRGEAETGAPPADE